jgi:alkylated DNA nucleotide flippase Atl1
MDDLEKIIMKNRQLFDSVEPSSEHFIRFQTKLDKIQKRKIKPWKSWMFAVKVASVSVLFILSALYVNEHLFIKNSFSGKQENNEVIEAQQYYNHLVTTRINQIEQLNDYMTPEQKQMLKKEFTEMDEMYKKLLNDYNKMPNDPRIIQSLLKHYQMKTEILNRIVNDLKNIQTQKQQKNENIEL